MPCRARCTWAVLVALSERERERTLYYPAVTLYIGPLGPGTQLSLYMSIFEEEKKMVKMCAIL